MSTNTTELDSAPALTAQQYAIVDGLADGYSIASMARAQGLHRTTIHHWLRTQPDFAEALRDARLDRAQEWQAAADLHAAAAFALVRQIMDDKTASHATRLRAAALIINQSTKNPPPPTQDQLKQERLLRAMTAIAEEDRPSIRTEALARDAKLTPAHHDAICTCPTCEALHNLREQRRRDGTTQHSSLFITSTPISEPDDEIPEPEPAPAPIQTIRRDGPKIGRNDKCPCGSNKKYKHCCLNGNKPDTTSLILAELQQT